MTREDMRITLFGVEQAAYAAWQSAGLAYGTPESAAFFQATRNYLRLLEVTGREVGNYIPQSTGSTGGDWFDEVG